MLCTIGSVGQEGQDSLCNVQRSVMDVVVVMICSMLLSSVLHVALCSLFTSVSVTSVYLREGLEKWIFKMAFALRRQTHPPLMAITSIHSLPHFLLQLNSTSMMRILHLVPLKNIVFKSSYN